MKNIDSKLRQEFPYPVLLTLHVRADYLEIQLSKLLECGVSQVFVSVDGPRNDYEVGEQEKIFDLLNQYSRKFKRLVIKRELQNRGIAVAMISAIDWFFQNTETGLIFEDDILFDCNSLNYFSNALVRIETMPDVLMASGQQPFFDANSMNQVSYTNYPQIWGWGTHHHKWKEMREMIFRYPKANKNLPLKLRSFWITGWERVHDGFLDTWDLPIATGMLFSGKLCMLPPVNLTSNIGFDKHSSNTKSRTFPLGLEIQSPSGVIDFYVAADFNAIKEINSKYEDLVYHISSWHLLTNKLKVLDRFRFSNKRKLPLGERIK